MLLNDIANDKYIFQSDEKNRGLLTCRKCGKEVVVEIKIVTIIFFATSRIRVFGKWCGCSDLNKILKSLVGEGM